MKNFPSALIKQKSTKNGLGNSLNDTIKNIGNNVLSNILNGRDSSDKISRNISKGFNTGLTRPDLTELVDEYNLLDNKVEIKEREDRINSLVNLKYNTWQYRNSDNSVSNRSLTMDWSNNNIKRSEIYFEDPFSCSSSIFSVINNYNFALGFSNLSIDGFNIKNIKETKFDILTHESVVAPSLFNPFAGVLVNGITENIPLVDREAPSNISNNDINSDFAVGSANYDGEDHKIGNLKLSTGLWELNKRDLSDCSIKKLVELSQSDKSELGLATYRYADFMFCKDLGKIPNNRLITLRRFPAPVGDNIFKYANPKFDPDIQKNPLSNPFAGVPDIGRLITWFDNEDNKLEDICRYNYSASWKEFTAEIQNVQRAERDDGITNMLANAFSPQNNQLAAQGYSGHYDLFQKAVNAVGIPIIGNKQAHEYYGLETLSNYDKNKIYEPKNKIWSTHQYEGKLDFNQEIQLTFRYQLRSYSNINPKAAMLDLLGNIHVVTYKRGDFWGGEVQMYGPQGNTSVYAKADALVNKTFDKLGGFWQQLASGAFGIETLQNMIENGINCAKKILDDTKDTVSSTLQSGSLAEDTKDKIDKSAQNAAKKLSELNTRFGFTDALKGMVKNALGRPQIYALHSILSGDNVGPWHLTIGNPRNPIMSIGNLILTNSEIQHYGPLGIDDFPTEMRVTVTLKHAMPRDSVGIQRMYTQGMGSIYKPFNFNSETSLWKDNEAFGDLNYISNDKILKTNLSAI